MLDARITNNPILITRYSILLTTNYQPRTTNPFKTIRSKIFRIQNDREFRETALQLFRLQAVKNPVYRSFLTHLGISPEKVGKIEEIPFLPIRFFRNHTVAVTEGPFEAVFTSSGTTGTTPSRHCISDLSLYRESFRNAFSLFYGDPSRYCILALLPSYLDRQGSSLVYMFDHLIRMSGHPQSSFYLHDQERLYKTLQRMRQTGQRTLLFGVSYALLDFAEKYELPEMDLIVMETGGMKGRRREMVREELHARLEASFHVPAIHSEYGMTELLSQAYSQGEGLFRTPPWMRILIRDSYDPLSYVPPGRTGGINIIDLANIYSCAFIETQDLGRLLPGGTFTVEGRFDHSEMRGCNLMVQEI